MQCIDPACGKKYKIDDIRYACDCENLLDVNYNFENINSEELKSLFESRKTSRNPIDISGVWRFRELLPFINNESNIVTMPEGNTPLFNAPKSAEYAGMKSLTFKHQGMNPTGSFKDNGMTTAVSQAKALGAKVIACASTGNTSASMAAYAARAGMKAVVFIPDGHVAFGKLSQSLDYGAKTLQVEGDFDVAMSLVEEMAKEDPRIYLVNSVNPFRLEGQKTIMLELLQQRNWKVPDRIVVPGGNLGNASSFGKAFIELFELGIITKVPRITIIQAEQSAPLHKTITTDRNKLITVHAKTLATAIQIGNPRSWKKALRATDFTDGWIETITEQEIADAKTVINNDGINCEPTSTTTLAGIKKLVGNQVTGKGGHIDPNEDVVAILTGNMLKDPDYTVRYHTDALYEQYVSHTTVAEKSGKITSTFGNGLTRVAADKVAIKKILGLN